ncbi:MAG: hypothetical protein ABEJ89_10455 [Haloarculaceae archaeon]
MSVIQLVKSMIGVDEVPTYECQECGAEFEAAQDPDSYWFKCTECGAEDPLGGQEQSE